MSCTGCGSIYGFLKKEVGCETCGFSFCSKCCPKRTVTKNDSTSRQLTCNRCFDNLNSENKRTSSSHSPPAAHKKRMAALANRSYSVGSTVGNRSGSLSEGDEKDKEIAERLQRLKRERNKECLPSQLEIEERLAKLKGMDPSKFTAPPIMVYRPSDRRSSVEKATDLIKQMEDEVKLEHGRAKDLDDIASRLSALREESVPPSSSSVETCIPNVQGTCDEPMDIVDENKKMRELYQDSLKKAGSEIVSLENDEGIKKAMQNIKPETRKVDPDVISEEEEADLIIEKLLAAKLETDMEDPDSLNGVQVQSPDSESDKNLSQEEEFPWCVICTENAKLRCFGCDGDLYCIRCYKECHDSLDIKDHNTCPFLSPKV